jgi:hypothetical protein
VVAPGTVVVAPGTVVVVAPGTVVVAPGTVVVAPGTVVVAPGTVVVAPGTVVVAPGTVVVTPGTVVVAPGTVVVAPGTVVVAPGIVVLLVVVVAAHVGAVMVSLINDTWPVRARRRPSMTAPLFTLMLALAMTVPTNWVVVSIVAELPTCQKTSHDDALLSNTTLDPGAVVSVVPI